MPELPDIDAYCHALRARVVGQPLSRFELLSPFVLRTVTPAPASAEGRVVTQVSRLGKGAHGIAHCFLVRIKYQIGLQPLRNVRNQL